jgi:magnesium transporter
MLLSTVFAFHPLSIEDAILERPYPKVDEYPSYLYLVMHGMRPSLDGSGTDVRTRELDIFLGARYLVTFHHEEMRSIAQTRTLLEKNPEPLARGPAALLHRVLDYLVDNYVPVMEDLDRRIDALETAVSEGDGKHDVVSAAFPLRAQVTEIRRLASRQRDVVNRIVRQELPLIDSGSALYFRDVYDHLVRVQDQAESYRDLLSSLVEIALARSSNRLNSIMKTLTLLNTIFLPLTFITGIYGMNFDRLPGKGAAWGFWICVGGMATLAIVMLLLYRRKKWL